MDQEKQKMVKLMRRMEADIEKYRNNEERWSGRVTKLMEKDHRP
jgi:hypothetical protein